MKKVSKKKLKIVLFFSAFLLSMLTNGTLPIIVNAESNQEQLSYEVKPLLEKEQTDSSLDYFYYQVAPNEQKKIAVEIKNHAKKPQTFNVEFNRANTNGNGMIDYSLNKKIKEYEGTSKIDIQQLVDKPNQKVTVEANSSKTVTFHLTLPKNRYEGILLGGIYVTLINDMSQKKSQQSEGIELQHTLAYAIAVMLQEEIPYQGGNQLNVDSLNIAEKDNQSILKIDMQNPKPNVLNKVKMTIKIYREGEDQLYSEMVQENMNFAPEDWFSLEVPWAREKIQSGRYEAQLLFSSGENNWAFKKKFSVTQDEIKQIEKKLISQDKRPISKLNIYIFITLMTIIVILLILLLVKKRKGLDG
ncbi:WxL protein peptidoglycan domain-containing protein [Enterococcus faecalis]|uniref:WxL protein peptidoglycan domain-containing protein n=1 Tax=Enterococcus faecalis TaxID=1351 RepID=UPI0040420635